MMMKRIKRNGFALLLVIMLIPILGTEMVILARSSNTIWFQTSDAYVEACKRNLAASGLAWAEQNVKNQEDFGRAVELDTTDMIPGGSSLSVFVGVPQDGRAVVQIDALCNYRQRSLRHQEEYHIRF